MSTRVLKSGACVIAVLVLSTGCSSSANPGTAVMAPGAVSATAPSSSNPTTATTSASGAIVNKDGTVSLPAEVFRNEPEALAEAYLMQVVPAWAQAGANLARLRDVYASDKNIDEQSHEIAQENKELFAPSEFISDWASDSALVNSANISATNNEAFLFSFFITANDVNAPGADPAHPFPPVFGEDGKEAYTQTTSIANIHVNPESTPDKPDITATYSVRDNYDRTALPGNQEVESEPVVIDAKSRIVFVIETDRYGVEVYKVASIRKA